MNFHFPVIPTSCPDPGNAYGGCPYQKTFNLQIFLRRTAESQIISRGRPFPTAKRIVPATIFFWNKTKGMTDCFSRMQNNVKAPLQKLHPYAYMWLRMVMMMMYNAHVLNRLFSIEKFIKTPGSIKSLEQLRQALNSEGSFRASIA